MVNLNTSWAILSDGAAHGDGAREKERWTPSKRIANASAATAAGKSTVTRTASSSWSYLYRVGLYRLASSHSAMAVIVLENSAAHMRTVMLRMIPSSGVCACEHTLVANNRDKNLNYN